MQNIEGLFLRDNNGYVVIKRENSMITMPNIDILKTNSQKRKVYSSVDCWIELIIGEQKEHCLIKNKNFDGMFENNNEIKANNKAEEVAFYNNIVIPYIASEIFALESIEYLLCNDESNYNRKYILTFDAKREGEQLIEWKEFFSDKSFGEMIRVKNTIERIEAMKKFLIDKDFDENIIKKLEDQCIMQFIFKKFIDYKDDSLINMSLGFNEIKKEARIFPIYDVDFSSGITNSIYVYGEGDNATEADNGKTDLKSVIEQFKDRKGLKEYLKLIIDRFDMEKVFEKSKERTRT